MQMHAIEVATEKGYLVFVTADDAELDRVLVRLNSLPRDTWALGEVKADTEQEAVSKVMTGDWDYTQEG